MSCLHNPQPVLHQGGPVASGPSVAVCLFTRRNYAARLQDMVFSNSAYNHGNLWHNSRLNSLNWLLCTKRNTLQHVGNIMNGVKQACYTSIHVIMLRSNRKVCRYCPVVPGFHVQYEGTNKTLPGSLALNTVIIDFQ